MGIRFAFVYIFGESLDIDRMIWYNETNLYSTRSKENTT